jgi:hypothetical protein
MWEVDEEADDGGAGYFWMEGDSLAPPCAAEMDIVDAIVNVAQSYLKGGEDDLLIDLGCGDVSSYSFLHPSHIKAQKCATIIINRAEFVLKLPNVWAASHSVARLRKYLSRNSIRKYRHLGCKTRSLSYMEICEI